MSELKFEELYLVTSRNGLTKPKRVRGVGYKFINMGEIFAYGRIKNIPTERVPCTDKELKTSALEPGDLLFARQSLVLSGAGKCSIFICDQETTVFESHLIRVRLNTDLYNPLFYYYYFQSYEGKGNIYSIVEQGAGAAGIRGSDLARIKVPVFDLETQNKVSKELSNLDDKIHLLRQQNATLEAMAQALFKSWFVDFDPVIDNALAAGRALPEALAVRVAKRRAVLESGEYPKLPEEVRGLFPGGFVFSEELGRWVPEGWEVEALNDCGKIITGKTPPSKNPEHFGDDTLFVTPSDYKNYFNIATDSSRRLSQEGAAANKMRILPKHSILVTCIGSDMGKTVRNSKPCLTNQQINSIIPNPKEDLSEFLYCYMKHLYPTLRNLAFGGSTMPILNKGEFSQIKLLCPTKPVLSSYSKTVSDYFLRIEKNINSIATLTHLRDVLLPELISGRVGA